jgi:hypothetical protein
MPRLRSFAGALLLVAAGYLLGTGSLTLRSVTAQETKEDPTIAKIHEAHLRLQDAREALEADGKYVSITNGLNAFLILSGGGNFQEDLEAGRGVDPETFAALYAGRATPDIQQMLGVNEHGQITYNNEVVRIYSKSRLQQMYAERLKIEEQGM